MSKVYLKKKDSILILIPESTTKKVLHTIPSNTRIQIKHPKLLGTFTIFILSFHGIEKGESQTRKQITKAQYERKSDDSASQMYCK